MSGALALAAAAVTIYGFTHLPGRTPDALWVFSVLVIGGLAVLVPAALLTAHFAIAWSDMGRPQGWSVRLALLLFVAAIGGRQALAVPSLHLAWHVVTGQVSVEAPELRVSEDGRETLLWGPIENPLLALSLRDAVDGVDGATLTLSSPGGYLQVAEEMAHVVRQAGMTTRVADWCLSACTVVFLAGERAVLGRGGHLGFHRPYIELGGPDDRARDSVIALGDDAPAVVALRRALTQAGAAPWFVDKALATPLDEMWYPTREELANSGLSITLE